MADYTSVSLLADAKLYGAVPGQQPAFTDTQILGIMTDELRTTIAPFMMQFREEYFVVSTDFTITNSTTEFSIPTRAVAGGLRDLKLVNGDDTESDVPILNMEYQQSHYYGFYLQGNKVKLIQPANYTTFTLRMYYFVRQPTLVETTDCAKVATVGDTTFTVDSIPAAMTSGQNVDIVQAVPPFNLLSQKISATWTGTTVTPSTMPTGLAIGDYMCNVEESPIPLIPVELRPLLVQSTVMRFNEILADSKGLKQSTEKFNTLKQSLTDLLSPRVSGELKTINNYDNFLDRSSFRIENLWD